MWLPLLHHNSIGLLADNVTCETSFKKRLTFFYHRSFWIPRNVWKQGSDGVTGPYRKCLISRSFYSAWRIHSTGFYGNNWSGTQISHLDECNLQGKTRKGRFQLTNKCDVKRHIWVKKDIKRSVLNGWHCCELAGGLAILGLPSFSKHVQLNSNLCVCLILVLFRKQSLFRLQFGNHLWRFSWLWNKQDLKVLNNPLKM